MLQLLPSKINNMHFYGSRKNKKIAITFDDGPSNEAEKILDALKENKAKATFFIWGQRIKGREKIIGRIINEGHEIGNHSYSHKKALFKSKKFIEEDLIMCDKELKKLGIKTKLFRPPGFSIGITLYEVCKKLNKKIIFCDVISNDWKKPGISKVVDKVIKKTKNGSIINFHDYLEGMGNNKEIVPIIKKVVPELKKSYKLVTVSELLT